MSISLIEKQNITDSRIEFISATHKLASVSVGLDLDECEALISTAAHTVRVPFSELKELWKYLVRLDTTLYLLDIVQ